MNSFDKKLKHIIGLGDTSKDYRNLFKKIVKFHREEFTEENFATSENYIGELLRDALTEAYDKEILHK
jgi:predicted metal-dependent hydrolase